MKQYKFKWKRKGQWFWRTATVEGHGFNQQFDRMMIFFPDGSLKEIPKWSDCFCTLGVDWVLATKDQMEKEAGAPIKIRQL
jgi:hypothetical protein